MLTSWQSYKKGNNSGKNNKKKKEYKFKNAVTTQIEKSIKVNKLNVWF